MKRLFQNNGARSLMRILGVLALASALPGMTQPVHATSIICYVDIDATGTNEGTSWTNAYTNFQNAMEDVTCQEVWVAKGVYIPGGTRNHTFEISPGVRVYGGFTGTETASYQRDPWNHVTILSGDADGNDTNTDGNYIAETVGDIVGNNCYTVVSMHSGETPITDTTVLDGFTITAGFADVSPASGGGLFCDGTGGECSPTLSNLVFSGNSAGNWGGALYNKGWMGTSSPTLTNVTFTHNTAPYGGAMFNDGESGTSNPNLIGVTFDYNSSSGMGGAMANYGLNSGASSPALTNVTFFHNSASYGGAIANNGSNSGTSSPSISNVTFHENSGSDGGGAVYSDGTNSGNSSATFTNVILWGDLSSNGAEVLNNQATPSIDYSVVEGGCPSGATCTSGLITDNPLLGTLADNGGPTQTIAIGAQSSALDMAYDFMCWSPDQRGLRRPQGAHCDIGAYERQMNARADFDADGISDMGYFHPLSGLWGVLPSANDFSYGSSQYFTWGQTGDLVAPGDYDGDGIWDPTVRRPPAGGQSAAYMMLLSSTGYDYGSPLIVPAGWPGLGDTPVIGDYNGDGISDPAIFRGNTGVWIIPLSPTFTTYQFFSWGTNGDKPVGADVDGDGKTDIGYWRPSTGVWGFLRSSQNYIYDTPLFFSWGTSGDTPAMADYDGDLKADPTVVIPPAGGQSKAYRILLSRLDYDPASSMTVPAGWPGLGDTPVPADYDGDLKADAGIWRNNTGVWIIPESSTNNTTYMFASWGATGDQIAR